MADKIVFDSEGLLETFDDPTEGVVKYVCGKNPEACEKILSNVNMSSENISPIRSPAALDSSSVVENPLAINTSPIPLESVMTTGPTAFQAALSHFVTSDETSMVMPQEVIALSHLQAPEVVPQSPVNSTASQTASPASPSLMDSPSEIPKDVAEALKTALPPSPSEASPEEAPVAAAIAAVMTANVNNSPVEGRVLTPDEVATVAVSVSDQVRDDNIIDRTPAGQQRRTNKPFFRAALSVATAVAVVAATMGTVVPPENAVRMVNANIDIANKNVTQFANSTLFIKTPFNGEKISGFALHPIGIVPDTNIDIDKVWQALPSTTVIPADNSTVPSKASVPFDLPAFARPPASYPEMPSTGLVFGDAFVPPATRTRVPIPTLPAGPSEVSEPVITVDTDVIDQEQPISFTIPEPTSIASPTKYTVDTTGLFEMPEALKSVIEQINNVEFKKILETVKNDIDAKMEDVVEFGKGVSAQTVTVFKDLLSFIEDLREKEIFIAGFDINNDYTILVLLLFSLLSYELVPIFIESRRTKKHTLAFKSPTSGALIEVKKKEDTTSEGQDDAPSNKVIVFQKYFSRRLLRGEYLFR